ncbi:hypothetical protein [Oceanicoccus sp. KOV_DT_Chl]|uniref:hypothetical protein n=1 Tax=Oceanicoccus sp. KOV_DT_Chl TaxID=1904639 RepID=UPI001F2D7B9A|nr:hypothetical protein [Oceanicoccus sp. KOV_DT_Chl]
MTDPLQQSQSQLQSQDPAQSQVETDAERVKPAGALDYNAISGSLDDTQAADGSVKTEWGYLLNSLKDLGPSVLSEREQKARRILRDDGATYNIYAENGSPAPVGSSIQCLILLAVKIGGGLKRGC